MYFCKRDCIEGEIMNFAACVTNDKTLDMIPNILNDLYKKYTGCDAAEITELPS